MQILLLLLLLAMLSVVGAIATNTALPRPASCSCRQHVNTSRRKGMLRTWCETGTSHSPTCTHPQKQTHTHTHTHTTIHTHSRTQTQVAKRFQSYCLSFYVYERHVRLQICALQEQIPWRRFAFQKEIFCNCMRLTVNFFCPLHTSKTSSLVSLHFRAFSTTCQHVQMQVSKTPPCTSLTKLCVLEAWLLQFNRCGYKFPACPHVSVRNPCASLCVTKGATA